MLFTDWKQHPPRTIPKRLLWEYDIDNFSPRQWKNMAVTVARRVIELGSREDWYALMQLYVVPRIKPFSPSLSLTQHTLHRQFNI